MIRQQGVVESLHRDLMVGFGNWEFDPMELSNPFPNNESFVHIWQGFEDPLVPVKLQQYVCRKQQWIRYHEVMTDGGHLIMYDTNLFEAILRELLLPSSV
ncbi:ALPHA/BETA-HYDROLASES SUPERFAMILY PROTEIN [Salix koriyanagi]|uniref:ALPHA/BETA-HYDROLASES SUPERFAMILY PROTEIN n=1 Tax=Salix koriyanagi TaxID=2511006 RepID=A0A9Q0TSY2_9ROSI|nr:ALPHA/BETA-HYDROLASES SUPERFAMILY PROTEIN [Salix koriyanagi]